MTLRRIGLVAKREFLTTVSGKGFLIGVLLLPILAFLIVSVAPRILASRTPQVTGEVRVIDRSGAALPELRAALDPRRIGERRAENARRVTGQLPGAAGAAAASRPAGPPVPQLQLTARAGDADLPREQQWLGEREAARRHVALIVIHPDAVSRAAASTGYGGYDLYVASGLDEGTEGVIHDGLREALVRARLTASGLDPVAVQESMRVARPNAVIVATGGKQRARSGFNRALPFIMGILLFMGVITGGQTLMTSTIEEKSSRVVEVLLAALSPLELMWGKLIGQLGVGLLVMAMYVGLGVMALFQFALFGLIDPVLIVYLFVYFLITYLVFGALMMAVGAAVNQIADAQSMMGPIMLLLIAPYVLAPIIGQAPNSAFSVAMSFIPPVNTFAMLARLASASPPPAWQAWLTALVGFGAAALAVWFAAKVFKVGLLMHGKPPGFATLLRWARMA